MITLTITVPRDVVAARALTLRTSPTSSSRASRKSPESMAGRLMTTSSSCAPPATASSAAAILAWGCSAPYGKATTVHTLTSEARRRSTITGRYAGNVHTDAK